MRISDWSSDVCSSDLAKSWARVYNSDPYDRLKSWTNFNLSVRVDGPEDLTFEAYVENVFNSTPLTDAFLNSDDTGLTTNVFTLDPRIIRSEEHTSELKSLMRISYAVFCLNKKNIIKQPITI